MQANVLKAEIDAYAARLWRTAPLAELLARGAVTPRVVASYLYSLFYLIGFTEPHLARAARRASELDRSGLAEFFQRKMPEERGHDAWALGDLAELRDRCGVTGRLEPTPAIVRLVRALEAAIDENPASYVGYMTFAEYFTVVAGPAWIRLLSERCGVPVSALSVVARHVELDGEHAARGFEELDALVDSVDEAAVFRAVRVAMQCLESFYDELAAEAVAARPELPRAPHAA